MNNYDYENYQELNLLSQQYNFLLFSFECSLIEKFFSFEDI